MKKKKRQKLHENNHHIIPTSRLKGKTVLVPVSSHDTYHKLFGNMTPPEIVDYLNRVFWDDEYAIFINEGGE